MHHHSWPVYPGRCHQNAYGNTQRVPLCRSLGRSISPGDVSLPRDNTDHPSLFDSKSYDEVEAHFCHRGRIRPLYVCKDTHREAPKP